MDKSYFIIKGNGWERDGVENAMIEFPDNFITNLENKKPYIQVKARSYIGSHKTIEISPLEGSKLMIFFSDMYGKVREGFLPILATTEHVEVQYKNMTFDIKLDYSPDF
jgi:hypothetical protein